MSELVCGVTLAFTWLCLPFFSFLEPSFGTSAISLYRRERQRVRRGGIGKSQSVCVCVCVCVVGVAWRERLQEGKRDPEGNRISRGFSAAVLMSGGGDVTESPNHSTHPPHTSPPFPHTAVDTENALMSPTLSLSQTHTHTHTNCHTIFPLPFLSQPFHRVQTPTCPFQCHFTILFSSLHHCLFVSPSLSIPLFCQPSSGPRVSCTLSFPLPCVTFAIPQGGRKQ